MHPRRHQSLGIRRLDRLPLVVVATIALVFTAGCEKDKGSGAEQATKTTRSRVNAVQAEKGDKVSAEEFCDVMPPEAQAAPLELPPLADDAVLAQPGSWMWLNIWATWCKPCIEEIPLLARASADFKKKGVDLHLQFLSADEEGAVVAEFQSQHPELKNTLRLADPEALSAWMEGLGVTGATLPIHILADQKGRVRCIRASAIEEKDLEGAQALVAP